MLRQLVLVVTMAWAAGFMASPRVERTGIRVNLFGGGKKEGGGALSNVAGVMDQFKKAQQIAKRSNELQAELAKTILEGSSEDGKIVIKITGQQTPDACEISSLDDYDSASLSTALTQALKAAQEKSLEAMNLKMQELYAEIGFGAPPPAAGSSD